MAEPKKMEPGRTKIGTITAKDENEMVKEYTICFGNIAFPQKNGKFMHLRDERYREILSKFLDSDEGLNYIAPTEEEIEKEKDKLRQSVSLGKPLSVPEIFFIISEKLCRFSLTSPFNKI